jgi:hypothetical protein
MHSHGYNPDLGLGQLCEHLFVVAYNTHVIMLATTTVNVWSTPYIVMPSPFLPKPNLNHLHLLAITSVFPYLHLGYFENDMNAIIHHITFEPGSF